MERLFDDVPWRLIAGGIGLVLLWARRERDAEHSRLAFRAAPLLALAVATFLVRRLIVSPAFFHQGGLGPLVVMGANDAQSHYGPGYAEVLGWASELPFFWRESAIFTSVAVICSMLPPLCLLVARAAGAPPLLAWILAIGAAIDPLLARVSQSESYFGPCSTLLVGAAAALMMTQQVPPADRRSTWLGILSAGLLCSECARFHPNTWAAVAVTPVVLLLGPGSTLRRLVVTITSGAMVGAIILVTSGLSLLRVMRGDLGGKWVPIAAANLVAHPSVGEALTLSIMAIVAAVVIDRRFPTFSRYRLGLLSVAVAGLPTAACTIINDQSTIQPWIYWATFSLYLPGLVAGSAGLISNLIPTGMGARWGAIGLGAIGLGAILLGTLPLRWPSMTRVPTDTAEEMRALEWRRQLDPAAEIWYLESPKVPGSSVQLPLPPYIEGDQSTVPRLHGQRGDTPPTPEPRIGQTMAYYYRSSLCGRSLSHEWCDAYEARLDLTPVRTWTMPAIPSSLCETDLFTSPSVNVGLYRIDGIRR